MSSFERKITFETEEGNQYLISFSPWDNLDEVVSIPVIDVSLTLMSDTHTYNSTKTLQEISNHIFDYLESFTDEIIIYFYCDKKEIQRRNKDRSPQEYRSLLFTTLSKRKINNSYILKKIHIEDIENGDHFICLITHINNENEFNKIESHLTKNFTGK